MNPKVIHAGMGAVSGSTGSSSREAACTATTGEPHVFELDGTRFFLTNLEEEDGRIRGSVRRVTLAQGVVLVGALEIAADGSLTFAPAELRDLLKRGAVS